MKKDLNININNQCPFCQGTGIVKCFDFVVNSDLPAGEYDFNTLIEEKGGYTQCPEGCEIMN